MQWCEYNGRLLETTSQIELSLSRGIQIIAPAVNTFQIHRCHLTFMYHQVWLCYKVQTLLTVKAITESDFKIPHWVGLFGGCTRDSTKNHITTCHLRVFEQIYHQLQAFWGRSTVGLTPSITWGSRLLHLSESFNELKSQSTLLPLFPNSDSCVS